MNPLNHIPILIKHILRSAIINKLTESYSYGS